MLRDQRLDSNDNTLLVLRCSSYETGPIVKRSGSLELRN